MKKVAISILGTVLDRRGKRENRWNKWRPTPSLCQQDGLAIDRLDLIFDPRSLPLAKQVAEDIKTVSADTEVVFHLVSFDDPWDFESVYSNLLDFSRTYPFAPDDEDYLIHITTGTHVAQICLYLLTEAGYLPGRLIQTSPKQGERKAQGSHQIIDLDLSKYDQIAARFNREHQQATHYLKGGIETNNSAFNLMIEQLEKVSIRSDEPLLISGPTGAGKSQLAKRVYQLRKQKGSISGQMVAVNCATLRGENAMSALFGHKRGAFTGASSDRAGLLMEADKGLLFLDEIGELGLDEQAMLLCAIEDKRFMPFGSDKTVSSNFQLIVGSNRDLPAMARQGKFRADLLARIDIWSYELPGLKDRLEDLQPNLDHELDKYAQKAGQMVRFNSDAKKHYLAFASSNHASWSANFRDLNASVTRMATLADHGRINKQGVLEEIQRLKKKWQSSDSNDTATTRLLGLLDQHTIDEMDYYEQLNLDNLIRVCQQCQSMAEAGRILFNKSREKRTTTNDSHRVKQLLGKYNLNFNQLKL
ncbi:transcriptional regulatory protein RtcR [Sinobacterium caligoides]|uniref:Transcriptional regulatory protein RtcR n=1 Tax=Sinobacterium caligoides TaxID=933926 RepID=A0A3N2E0M1_9GAMM|nr:RNA repair transcriptional activator RtcR [Sinobacterium caligoides]ROS05663.1 transcriptional regulatory protein RtcR [Sinobacterium caligoides]